MREGLLWIAFFLPDLPFCAGVGSAALDDSLTNKAIAIADGPEHRPHVRACNAAAQAQGIAAGMRVAQARALHCDLVVMPRNAQRETTRLQRVAHVLLAFTPTVCIEPDLESHCVLMEVAASVQLFHGGQSLVRQACAALRTPAFVAGVGDVFWGAAATPLAATLFARARAAGITMQRGAANTLTARIAPLPIVLAPWLAEHVPTLHLLGVQHFETLLGFSRAGLTQRFGATLTQTLAALLGEKPDPRLPFVPSAQFSAVLDCLIPIHEGPPLMAGVAELLDGLDAWLQARASGTRAFDIIFEANRGVAQTYPLATHRSQRDVKQWLRLLTEQFSRTPLAFAASRITLVCAESAPLENENTTLFGGVETVTPQWLDLLDRLHARLGRDAVYGLKTQADHRPEHASASDAPMRGANMQMKKGKHAAEQGRAEKPPSSIRPFFLLPRPRKLVQSDATPAQPQLHGPLTLLSPPERIQSGWWDDAPVERDYFIARNKQGTLCWIFQSLDGEQAWFLHGYFA